MRIISYNILDGGEGRADPLAEVIEAQRPDVVALVEADFAPTVERIAARLDMDYILAEANDTAAALLSRWPIEETVNVAALEPELSRSFLRAVVCTSEWGSLPIGVVHLHAYAFEGDENRRMREIRVVLDHFSRIRDASQPHLLAGDFNASAPSQQIDVSECKPSTRQAFQANGGRIPRRVVQSILDAGYIDAIRTAMGPQADRTGTFTTQHPGERVDYIFTFGIPVERLKTGWIEQDRLAKYASDHFPVGLEIG